MPKLNSGVSEATAANPGFMNSDDAANRAMLYLKLLADIFLTLWWKNSIDLLYQSYLANSFKFGYNLCRKKTMFLS